MTVRIEKKENVWTIIHSRPKARNAMDPDSADALYKAFIEFEKSLSFIKSKSKKTIIYSKLAYICESEAKFDKAIEYLKKIEIISNNKDAKVEAFRNRLNIMDEISRYLDYISLQEKSLNKLEQTKKEIEKQYFEDVNATATSVSTSTSPM